MRLRFLASALALALLAACEPEPTPVPLDFTSPGTAQDMVGRLITAAASSDVIMVEVQSNEVAVSVRKDSGPETYAYRDGQIGQVETDLWYVDQASFDVSDFDISDVGALFRAAAGASGSAVNQRLQIVDYSGGKVMMTVSTNPESRAVFFTADGQLLETLDFGTPGGIARGLAEVSGASVYAIGIDSKLGVWADSASDDETIRRHRMAAVPVTTTATQGKPPGKPFSSSIVSAAAIWSIVSRHPGQDWSVEITATDKGVLMRFHFGDTEFTTTLAGKLVES
ncbi:MAG: hypothetical protein LBR58_10225 [Propionibacteriaceae bacterium]|nr:hypothetical protein [Propionibacteriaceae bacterium]